MMARASTRSRAGASPKRREPAEEGMGVRENGMEEAEAEATKAKGAGGKTPVSSSALLLEVMGNLGTDARSRVPIETRQNL